MTTETDNAAADSQRDYSKTLFLPATEFPMRAGLPKAEPEWLARWEKLDVFGKLREQSKDREKFILHDGPPYANGNLHIGHALNKILKDIISRSFQMLGYNSHYVPGWDCHGLPIEWKVEEQYRAKGKDKDAVPINEFRAECRAFAQHWMDVQAEEFKRLGVEGDWDKRYATMDLRSEALIAGELMKFALNGLLYRGSKPVMWSVVERTALAEAEVEYQDYQSDTVWVKFPVVAGPQDLSDAFIVIWTTTPWTMPGNRAICYSKRVGYGLYEVTGSENDFGPQAGEKLVFADTLAAECFEKAKLTFNRVRDVTADELASVTCAHPLRGKGYEFDVPLLEGDHVTDDAGTGFVHTAPGHGREDFEAWMDAKRDLEARGIDTTIPYTVGADGAFTSDAPGFEGEQVITDKGDKGKANEVVIKALIEADRLFARGRLKHTYPHSWRSKKPVIFRNTPQWFIAMDADFEAMDGVTGTLRDRALKAISDTRFVPGGGKTRLNAMIEQRPDWVISRQRAWGVPISVFVNKQSGEVIPNAGFNGSEELGKRIVDTFTAEGADAWFKDGAKERFLDGLVANPDDWEKVDDILDVWFESGSTHAFVLEERDDMKWPADVYLEGTDQHRGWFHSSLLESCGTRGRAPYDAVITHGFTMDEEGRKMSKSLGNVTAPQDIVKQYGADILRMWVSTTDYADDQRIGPEIVKSNVDSYRKLRNTMRWMLGNLAHHKPEEDVDFADMPELERYVLHRLTELDTVVQDAYRAFDFRRITQALFNFSILELSAFYFDVRKDALYCDPISSTRRRACLTVLDKVFDCMCTWLAPLLPFTMEEAWLSRHPSETGSVHFELMHRANPDWKNEDLAAKWRKVRTVRRVVTGALELERAAKTIGSSLEAAPKVHVADANLWAAVQSVDMADICITSDIEMIAGEGPADAFRLDEVDGVSVVFARAQGRKCARSWKITGDIGTDPDFPDISARDAKAMHERAEANLGG
ncbi:isoleucine--tRNA ligase [Tepidamorphus sp. 3E244]|uniref:isoleucine--tRNA ligase n=1 Tax=Tepidamorphus sp. 3E244 TaxID=3385498 RepID=UPI0038FD19A9